MQNKKYQDKTLSVGIPYHSKTLANNLKEAIDSILNQSLIPEALLMIQNGDVPANLEMLVNDYCEKNSIMQQIHVPELGLPAALNASILVAETDYYARMDSDDIAVTDRFEKQMDFLQRHDEIDILGSWAWEFSATSGTIKKRLKRMPTEPAKMREWFHYRNPFIHPTVIFKTESIKKLGLYNEGFKTDQDLELWGRAIKAGLGIANLSEPLLFFRTDNMLAKRSKIDAVMRQVRARYSLNTPSLKLNILKVLALIFRLTPRFIREAGYKYLR